jgi:hypothetical protein
MGELVPGIGNLPQCAEHSSQAAMAYIVNHEPFLGDPVSKQLTLTFP